MKKYVYNKNSTCACIDFAGVRFELKKGDIITKYSDGDYEFGSHVFLVLDKDLKSLFMRVYTTQEQMRYERIREQAMIAAMQSLIEKMPTTDIADLDEVGKVTANAVRFADSLVGNLKDKEF